MKNLKLSILLILIATGGLSSCYFGGSYGRVYGHNRYILVTTEAIQAIQLWISLQQQAKILFNLNRNDWHHDYNRYSYKNKGNRKTKEPIQIIGVKKEVRVEESEMNNF